MCLRVSNFISVVSLKGRSTQASTSVFQKTAIPDDHLPIFEIVVCATDNMKGGQEESGVSLLLLK